MPVRRGIVLALCLIAPACHRDGASHAGRDAAPAAPAAPAARPTCATQDCKTGKIVDDGCVDDGHGGKLCASCVNACPPSP